LNAVGWAEPVKAQLPPFPAISQRRESTTFKNFNPFKQFKMIIGFSRRLERLERLERFERERSDIIVDILSGYPILPTYELSICFREASI
jgi:hypothetical protein